MSAELRNDRLAFAEVLAMWAEQGEVDSIPRGRLAAEVDRANCSPADVRHILGNPKVEAGNLYDPRVWITGPRVSSGTPTFIPRATASIGIEPDTGDLVASIRVALLFAVDNKVRAAGWRFELAEKKPNPKGDPPPHPYPHAQPIEEWVKRVPLVADESRGMRIPASEVSQRLVNQSRPAFPLRGGNTAAGLAVVMLATLYGAPTVRSWLRLLRPAIRDGKFPQPVQDDIALILR